MNSQFTDDRRTGEDHPYATRQASNGQFTDERVAGEDHPYATRQTSAPSYAQHVANPSNDGRPGGM